MRVLVNIQPEFETMTHNGAVVRPPYAEIVPVNEDWPHWPVHTGLLYEIDEADLRYLERFGHIEPFQTIGNRPGWDTDDWKAVEHYFVKVGAGE